MTNHALDIFADTEERYPFAKPIIALSALGTGYKAGAIPYVLGMDLGSRLSSRNFFFATKTITVADFSGQAAIVNDHQYNNFAIYVFYVRGRIYQVIAVYNVPGNVPGSSATSNEMMAGDILATFKSFVSVKSTSNETSQCVRSESCALPMLRPSRVSAPCN